MDMWRSSVRISGMFTVTGLEPKIGVYSMVKKKYSGRLLRQVADCTGISRAGRESSGADSLMRSM